MRQIRQFYYFRLSLYAKHAVTMYIFISIVGLPLTLVMLILHLFSLGKSGVVGWCDGAR